MDPALIGKRRLRTTEPRDRGIASVAGAALMAAVAVFGVLQARDQPPAGAQGPSSLAAAPNATYLSGSLVPAPATSFGFRTPVAHRGAIILRLAGGASPLTLASSQTLFASYLSSMSAQGWTLLGKGDPSRTGEWTLRWQFKQQAALLTLTMRPTARLEVDLCPPKPYC